MKNYFIILGLAFVFLFLFACGKKENSNEIKLLPETKQTAKKAVKERSTLKKTNRKQQKNTTRPVLIKVYEKGFPSKNATVKIKKSTKKTGWWIAETDEEGNAELSIPSKWKYLNVTAQKGNYALATFFTNNLTPGNSPINVELNLDEEGVIITAELIGAKQIEKGKKDIFAKITSDFYKTRRTLKGASSTVCKNNKIIFPPIKPGLKRLKILVVLDNFAKSYSDYFDTLDGTNKTVKINLLPIVKFYGRAVRADGTPITNVYFRATPRGLYEKSRTGHVHAKMHPDKNGNFEVFGLIEGYYKLLLTADYGDDLSTNIVIYSDEENRYLFIFPTNKFRTIKGIVKYETTDEPAEGIKIEFEIFKRKCEKYFTTTDKDGNFQINLPVYNTELKINEPDYAQINLWIYKEKNNEFIKLYLRQCGIITGTITDKNGNPIQGIKAEFNSKYYNKYRNNREAYCARSQYPSNEEGVYVISNVAAPDVYYLLQAYGKGNSFLPNGSSQESIKVNPNKTTVYNFKMPTPPKVKIKFINENGDVILKYKIDFKLKFMGQQGRGTINVNLDDTSKWRNLPLWNGSGKMNLSILAQSDDGKVGTTNNIQITSDEEYKIVLKVNEHKKVNVSGFVYDYEMKPIVDKRISARTKFESNNSQTDHLGFFEIFGLEVKNGTKLSLNVNINDTSYSTNVLSGSEDIEWILPKPKRVTGRVFIENLETPATNFFVSALNNFGKSRFKCADGKFSVSLDLPLPNKPFNIIISADGYVEKKIQINPQDESSFNIGDVILNIKSAKISGRVIDQNDNPLHAYVRLVSEDEKKLTLSNMTDKNEGSYFFKNVTPSKYHILVKNQYGQTNSETFTVYSDDDYKVPDIILQIPSNIVKISGIVTLNGEVLKKGSLYFSNGEMISAASISNGKFEINMSAGETVVSCIEKNVVTTVNLISGENNEINFISGTAKLIVKLPYENYWAINLVKKIGKRNVPVSQFYIKNNKYSFDFF